MSRFFFPDNTVLVNFGHINRLDTLKALLGDRGRWCATVAQECAASAAVPGLEALGGVGAIFGDPERPTAPELIDARLLRDRMAEPGDGPYAHLGEAETVAIMSRRYADSYFVTDDRGAGIIARSEGLTTITTWDLLRVASKAGLLTQEQLWEDLEALREAGRARPPAVYGYTSFTAWLNGPTP